MGLWDLRGAEIESGYRDAAIAAADDADLDTALAAVTERINCYGADELWVRVTTSAANTTATLLLVFLDTAGDVQMVTTMEFDAADANSAVQDSRYVIPAKVTAVPGAARLAILVRALANGNVSIFAGTREE